MRLIRTDPKHMGMIRRFFSEKMEFLCHACVKLVESRYRIETMRGIICDGCHSVILEGGTVTPYRDRETKPWNAKRNAAK